MRRWHRRTRCSARPSRHWRCSPSRRVGNPESSSDRHVEFVLPDHSAQRQGRIDIAARRRNDDRKPAAANCLEQLLQLGRRVGGKPAFGRDPFRTGRLAAGFAAADNDEGHRVVLGFRLGRSLCCESRAEKEDQEAKPDHARPYDRKMKQLPNADYPAAPRQSYAG